MTRRANRQWHGHHPRKHARRPRKQLGPELLLGSAALGLIAWQAAPDLHSFWQVATKPPEQIKAVEQSAYYPNCDAARAAGAAPIHAGSPGYREPLDADLDGVACEPYRAR